MLGSKSRFKWVSLLCSFEEFLNYGSFSSQSGRVTLFFHIHHRDVYQWTYAGKQNLRCPWTCKAICKVYTVYPIVGIALYPKISWLPHIDSNIILIISLLPPCLVVNLIFWKINIAYIYIYFPLLFLSHLHPTTRPTQVLRTDFLALRSMIASYRSCFFQAWIPSLKLT